MRPLLLAAALLLAACGDDEAAPPPPPRALSADAVGYFCTMTVSEHPGSKAQVFVADRDGPLWFPSVREMFAYTMLPEETARIQVAYVSDTGRAQDPNVPPPAAWIDAQNAFYVVGTTLPGGMGRPEAVPFAERADADAFARRHGGEVHRFEEVTPDWVFATADEGNKP